MNTGIELPEGYQPEEDDDLGIVEQEEKEARPKRTDYREKITEKDKKEFELEDYGRRVQNRLSKAIYQRNTERAAREEVEIKFSKVSTDYEKLKHDFELLKHEREESTFAHSKAEIESTLAQKRSALKAAMDEGDTDKIADLNLEIAELGGRRAYFEQEENRFKQREKPKPPEEKPDNGGMPAAARAWLTENRDWYYDPKNRAAIQAAGAIESALFDEGMHPDDPDTYAELDRRLELVYPKISKLRPKRKEQDEFEADDEDEEKEPQPRPKPKVSGVVIDSGREPGEGRPGRFTERDAHNMRRFGFDPGNPEDRKAYLKHKT